MDPVLNHHLYEYEKGVRRLILHTVNRSELPEIERKLYRRDVSFEAVALGKTKANLYFGDDVCVQIIRRIGRKSLSELTPEEDFILGIMLGYCREKQCSRYLKRKTEQVQTSARLAG